MSKIIKISNLEILEDFIEYKKNIELESISDFYNRKREKKLDKVFLISSMRDKNQKKYNDLKIKELKNFKSLVENLEFKLNDNQISKVEFDSQLGVLQNETQKNVDQKLEKLNSKKEAKNQKWTKIIDAERVRSKQKIANYTANEEKEKEKISEIFEQKLNELKSEPSKIEQLDNFDFEQRNEKLKKNHYFKKLEKLESDFINQKVGPLTYEGQKNELAEKIDFEVEKLNNLNETKFSKKEVRSLNSKLLFQFSIKKKIQKQTLDTFNKLKLVMIIMAFALIIGLIEPIFFGSRNWKLIFTQNADLACMAIGVTIIILTGGIDLSIGSAMAFACAIGAKLIVDGHSMSIVIVSILGFCLISGLIAGTFVSLFKLPPFIVTLTLMLIWRGLTYIYLNNKVVPFRNDFIIEIANGSTIGIPNPVLIMLVLALAAIILLKLTKYGRSVYAIGGNYRAAELSGIRAKVILISVYMLAGIAFATGTILYMARVKVATPTTGNALELDAIACVVLGGTALTGGKGGILQTLIGWFVMSVLQNALVIVGIDPNVQYVIKGIVILGAIISDTNYNITKKFRNKLFKWKYMVLTI